MSIKNEGTYTLITIMLLCMVVATALSVIFQDPNQRYIKKNNCTSVSAEKSDQRIYCGKACSSEADVVTYYCKSDNSTRKILEIRK